MFRLFLFLSILPNVFIKNAEVVIIISSNYWIIGTKTSSSSNKFSPSKVKTTLNNKKYRRESIFYPQGTWLRVLVDDSDRPVITGEGGDITWADFPGIPTSLW